jgi:hypothetical protein
MTTICLSESSQGFKVWGNYDGDDDRFVFDVREFERLEEAEAFAKRMMAYHDADHFERIRRD